MIAEVAISKPEHQTIADTIKPRRRARLRHTRACGRTKRRKAGSSRIRELCECRISGCRKIHVEVKQLVTTGTRPLDKCRGRTSRRKVCAVEIRGQENFFE